MIRGAPMKTCGDCKSESREANCQRDVECCRPGRAPQSNVFVANVCREDDSADCPGRQPPPLSPLTRRSSSRERCRAETGNKVPGGYDQHDPNPLQATCFVQWGLLLPMCKPSRRCRDAHRGSHGRKIRAAKHSVSALRRASASAALSALARLSRGAPAATTLRPVRAPGDR